MAKATSTGREAVSPKRQKGSGKKSTMANHKKSGTSTNPTRKERHARSDTDEEHIASTSSLFPVIDGVPEFTDVTGLTERRERKRARQEIMNSREERAGTRGEKENKKDAKNDKRKQKIPAGLALMHGFSSASVGKSRLTVRKTLFMSEFYFIHPCVDRTAAKFRCISQGQGLRENKSR
jgi:hypothetical protein